MPVPDDLIDADDDGVVTVVEERLSHVHHDVHPDDLVGDGEHAHCHHAAHLVPRLDHCTQKTWPSQYSQLSLARSFGDYFLKVQITRSAN